MKNAIKIEAVLTILTVLLLSSASIPQAKAPNGPTQTWDKSPNNPVLSEGATWDSDGIDTPSIVYEAHPTPKWHMWYTGWPPAPWGPAVGYASSSNPIVPYTRGTHNPVLSPGPDGAWDDEYVAHPSVRKVGTNWYMFYLGYDGTSRRIGFALSASPDTGWAKYPGNPVLDVGAAGAWDSVRVDSPTAISDGGVWKMWYGGRGGVGTKYQIGYAVSPDCFHWSKCITNPVLTPGPSGSWDEEGVYDPTVWKEGGIYWMWYTGLGGDAVRRIGCAFSHDGMLWTKWPGNPVLSPGSTDQWDDVYVYGPTVIPFEPFFIMLYTGYDGDRTRIGYAQSLARLSRIPAFTESEADGTYFINADPLKPTMTLAVSAYDAVASGIIYGQCEYPQLQGFDTNPTWVEQTPGPNKGKPKLSLSMIVLFGSGWTEERQYGPNNVVGYYSRSLAPIKDIYPQDPAGVADSYALQKQDGTTVASRAFSWFDGHHDLIAIMAFADENYNFILIIYGYTYAGTWGGGAYFCQHMLNNLEDYWGYKYIVVEWSDANVDGVPQVGEMTQVAAGE